MSELIVNNKLQKSFKQLVFSCVREMCRLQYTLTTLLTDAYARLLRFCQRHNTLFCFPLIRAVI